MKYIYLISLALVVITGVNLEWELLSYRVIRVLTSFILFISCAAMTYPNRIPPVPLVALLLLATSDMFLLNWEYEVAKPMYYLVHSLASITLISCLKWKKGKPSLSLYDCLYILLIAGILSWVMVTLGHFFSEEMNNPVLNVLFYTNGFLSVILAITAFIFSANSTDKYSSYLLLAVVGLTTSDLFLFMIYIMDYPDLRYFDNFLNIFGCAILVKYIVKRQRSKVEDENAQMVTNGNQEEQKNLILEPAEKIKVYS